MLKLKGSVKHALYVSVHCPDDDSDKLCTDTTLKGCKPQGCKFLSDDLLKAHRRASDGRLTALYEEEGYYGDETIVLVLEGPKPLTRGDAVAVVYALNKGLEAI